MATPGGDHEWFEGAAAPPFEVALGNIDDDADLEAVFFGFDGKVHALDGCCPWLVP